jgi:transcriptional regulator with GAF, ATPase, and Fis domain
MAVWSLLTLKEVRRRHILAVLRATNWDLAKSSAILKVKERFLKREIRKIKLSDQEGPQG